MPVRERIRTVARYLAAAFFTGAGAWHFVHPAFYRQIVPPGFGEPKAIVAISGVAEIAGGLGLLVPRWRRPAGWGLIALLIAVFPANVYMAMWPDKWPTIPRWGLYGRLPMQGVMIVWVWWASAKRAVPTQGPRAVPSGQE